MKEVYSPETLAERWGCTSRHVRNIIARGDLKAFKIGNMLRIRKEALEEFELCQNGDLPGSSENSASPGMIEAPTIPPSGDVIDLARKTAERRKPAPRLDTRNSRGQPGRQ
jgi:excisionase family DNA binding protein